MHDREVELIPLCVCVWGGGGGGGGGTRGLCFMV